MLCTDKGSKKKCVRKRNKKVGCRRFVRGEYSCERWPFRLKIMWDFWCLGWFSGPEQADLASKLCTGGWSRWGIEIPLLLNYPCGCAVLHPRQCGNLPRGRWTATYDALVRLRKLEERKILFETQLFPHLLGPKVLTVLIWGLKLYCSGCWKLQTEMSVLLEYNSSAPVNISRFSSMYSFFYLVFHQ